MPAMHGSDKCFTHNNATKKAHLEASSRGGRQRVENERAASIQKEAQSLAIYAQELGGVRLRLESFADLENFFNERIAVTLTLPPSLARESELRNHALAWGKAHELALEERLATIERAFEQYRKLQERR